MPKVPTMALRWPNSVEACAHHQADEVLPLVPVTAITCMAALGSFQNPAHSHPSRCLS